MKRLVALLIVATLAPLVVSTSHDQPGPISNLHVSNTTPSSITWTWNAPTTGAQADGYHIEHDGTFTGHETLSGASVISWTRPGLQAGTSYCIAVRPFSSDGNDPSEQGPWSAQVCGSTLAGSGTVDNIYFYGVAPPNINGDGYVDFAFSTSSTPNPSGGWNWWAYVDGVAAFEITDCPWTPAYGGYGCHAHGATKELATNVASDITVRWWNGIDTPGQAHTITSAAPRSIEPAPIHSHTVTATSGSTIDHAWTVEHVGSPGFSAPTSYDIESTGSSSDCCTQIATPAGGSTTHTETGLTPETYYERRIYPVASSNYGNAFLPKGASTPEEIPGAPSNLQVTPASTSSLNLQWTLSTAGGVEDTVNSWEATTIVGSYAAGTTTSTITGLEADTEYCYYITASNTAGQSPASPTVCGTTDADFSTAPNTPSLTADASDSLVALTWSPTGGGDVQAYSLEADTGLLGTYEEIYGGKALSFQHTGLTNGNEYCYRISASNPTGTSPTSAIQCVTPTAPTLPQPTLSITPGNGENTLTWTTSGDYVTYDLEADTGPLNAYQTIVETQALTYEHATSNGNEVCYRVTPSTATITGPTSNIVCGTPQPLPLNAPVITALYQSYENGAYQSEYNLEWFYDGNTPAEYEIYRRTGTGSYGAAIATVAHPATSATGFNNLIGDYCFRLRAITPELNGPFSDENCETFIQSLPAAPKNLQATPGSGEIELTWEANPNGGAPNNYKIYRSPGGTLQVSSSTFSHTHSPATNGAQYCYYLTGINTAGEGPATPTVCAIAGLPANLEWTTTTYTCGTGLPDGTTWGNWNADPGATVVTSNAIRITNSGDIDGNVVIQLSPTFDGPGASIPARDGHVGFKMDIDALGPDCGSIGFNNDHDGTRTFTISPGNPTWIMYRLYNLPNPLPEGTYTGSYTITEI